ncbi:unnamed protein product [Ilex paraguariensis]|uniref:Uncharacterized protein n=1 Tax=Ilex paraguariensis TaxID=185542 RepID=A0ABC8S5U0_9AQUA
MITTFIASNCQYSSSFSFSSKLQSFTTTLLNHTTNILPLNPLHTLKDRPISHSPQISRSIIDSSTSMAAMSTEQSQATVESVPNSSMKLLFVEMGVGYDQHGQDVTKAAMKACRDAISSNSIPAFRRGTRSRLRGGLTHMPMSTLGLSGANPYAAGSIPGVSFGEMKLQIKLGVPRPVQQSLDIERVKSVFPYGDIVNFEVVDGGLICSSGVHVEEMGDKNDDCYIVNAAVYVGY